MQEIPIQPTASQLTRCVLNGQNVQLLIYQKPQGLFVDVNSNDVEIVSGIIAQNGNPIICRNYAGFNGNLFFIDSQGAADPEYTGLGDRYKLLYLDDAEYAAILPE